MSSSIEGVLLRQRYAQSKILVIIIAAGGGFGAELTTLTFAQHSFRPKVEGLLEVIAEGVLLPTEERSPTM